MDSYEVRDRFRAELDLSPWEYGIAGGVGWVMARSAVCGMDGYVMVPEDGHPWSREFPRLNLNKMDEIPLRDQLTVHGGLTVVQHPWLGFYTRHPGDVWDYSFDPMGVTRRSLSQNQEQRTWTTARVEREVVALARQVATIGMQHRQRLDSVRWASRVGLSRFKHLDVHERNTNEGEAV